MADKAIIRSQVNALYPSYGAESTLERALNQDRRIQKDCKDFLM